MAFLCLFDCWYGRRDQQNDPAPSVVLLPPYIPGLTPQTITRRYFNLMGKIIIWAYAYMMKAAGSKGI